MIAPALSDEQQAAVEAPFDLALLICGAPATGKSTVLRARVQRARSLGLAVLEDDDAGASERLQSLAYGIGSDAATTLRAVDDVEGEALFEEAAAPLLAMGRELVELEIDPEVPGLRFPERFLAAAFRLHCRLREALISPDEFLEQSLRGATEFYAKPRNFADPELIAATKNEHRDSLAVSEAELQRQYRREVDLGKLLAQLFVAYEALLFERACGAGRDAVAIAIERLATDGEAAARIRERYPLVALDDACALTQAEISLLRVVYGDELAGVTLAAPPSNLPQSLRRVELTHSWRPRAPERRERLATPREEAQVIATHVAQLLADGAQPGEIAVLMRSVSATQRYEEALLDRGIDVEIGGDYNVFADRRAHDALALLWNVHEPRRHDWLLRTLEGNAMALSDASLAILCGDSARAQTALFDLSEVPPPSETPHHDSERSVRLARNVLDGACDGLLSDLARERVVRFRTMRERWVGAAESLSFDDFVALVWREGLARDGAPDSSRARAQQRVLSELLERLSTYRKAHPDAALGDALDDAERRCDSVLERCARPRGNGVRLLSVECARGLVFDHVVIGGLMAGSFPRWYVPDAFLFSPTLGMIPKDNAGDATTARTAKFTYYVHRAKTAEKYNARERALYEYARSRARRSLLLTASGRPTRGITAPEFLEER
ncbi:MAG: 3'-5' exonuclease [Candidatus Tyrphobacter sp.]